LNCEFVNLNQEAIEIIFAQSNQSFSYGN